MNQVILFLGCGFLVGYLIFIVSFWFRAAKAHSQLVQYEYENVREQWEKDGEPKGMLFWKAPQPSKKLWNRIFRSNPANTTLIWVFYTPKWVKDYPDAQAYLKRLRLFVLGWNIGVIVLPFLSLLILLILEPYAK